MLHFTNLQHCATGWKSIQVYSYKLFMWYILCKKHQKFKLKGCDESQNWENYNHIVSTFYHTIVEENNHKVEWLVTLLIWRSCRFGTIVLLIYCKYFVTWLTEQNILKILLIPFQNYAYFWKDEEVKIFFPQFYLKYFLIIYQTWCPLWILIQRFKNKTLRFLPKLLHTWMKELQKYCEIKLLCCDTQGQFKIFDYPPANQTRPHLTTNHYLNRTTILPYLLSH